MGKLWFIFAKCPLVSFYTHTRTHTLRQEPCVLLFVKPRTLSTSWICTGDKRKSVGLKAEAAAKVVFSRGGETDEDVLHINSCRSVEQTKANVFKWELGASTSDVTLQAWHLNSCRVMGAVWLERVRVARTKQSCEFWLTCSYLQASHLPPQHPSASALQGCGFWFISPPSFCLSFFFFGSKTKP